MIKKRYIPFLSIPQLSLFSTTLTVVTVDFQSLYHSPPAAPGGKKEVVDEVTLRSMTFDGCLILMTLFFVIMRYSQSITSLLNVAHAQEALAVPRLVL